VISAKDEMIAGLEKSIDENKLDIKKIKSSKTWKLLKKLDSFRKDA